jgi:tetratricopeptide (TPR) repeat protein
MSDPFELVDHAQSLEDPGEICSALRLAIDQLMGMDDSSPKVAYALGYAWYMMPGNHLEKAEEYLRSALLRAPEHLYARLYVKYCCFDTRRYNEALALLKSFDPNEFSKFDQAWRDVKNAELAGC